MQSPQELPGHPCNTALLDFLRRQASPPSGPDDYTLETWQLHTHPDLIQRLGELAPGWPITAAYGVPILASQGIAAAVALGTDWLAVRTGHLPPGIETADPAPEWSSAQGNWYAVSPWQSHLSAADGTRALRELIAAALTQAAGLADNQPGGPSRKS